MDRDKLLDAHFTWPAKLRTEMSVLPQEFELLGLLGEFEDNLVALCTELIRVELPRLQSCGHYVDTLAALLKFPTAAQPLLFVGESLAPNQPPSRQEVIPVQQFKWVAERVGELLTRVNTPQSPAAAD